MAYSTNGLPPIHPGEMLADDLASLEMSARRFAQHIGVPHNAITAILNGQRGISAIMAIRIGKAFGTTPDVWLNLQRSYDLKTAELQLPATVREIKQLQIA
jgi:addiction module HigA family antidote